MNNLPNHVAIILDGNRRWAKKNHLPTIEGHRKGAEAVLKLVKKGKELGICIGSFWAFSTENWNRSKTEIIGLMKLFKYFFDKYINSIIKNKICFVHIGRKDRLPKDIVKKIVELEKKTKQFTEHYFVLALDYGGRDEIIRAIKKTRDSKLDFRDLNEDVFSEFLDTKDLPYPYPDLVIRTGGEMRLSGFMSWQIAYSELFFSSKYLPEFTPKDLELAIKEYSRRQRRFGS